MAGGLSGSWALILIWLLLYGLDNVLTVYVAGLYESQDPRVIEFEGGYELTPQFKDEIAQLKPFGPRFLRSAIITTAFLSVVWFLVKLELTFPAIYSLATGAMILLSCVVNLRHLQNISFFRFPSGSNRPQGSIYYPYGMIYRGSGFAFLAYAGFFILLAVLEGSWFFAGGVLSCLGIAFSHYRLAMRKPAEGKGEKE